ncbi:HAD family hydrolase [Natrarchaeobius halalkaliphilus]|uniref:HAD family hydrolase n=1 Tax=Natrarchaeobius halalkaliphilus TaxID=1679091 RepID=A0A3N6NV37_9EURY|nr:HAD family hydrolase [Natrarchaeobius halalkaliphilus]RQG87130.1 HAD family hydrolase [Natrarchaeobius halalkaliphilus]
MGVSFDLFGTLVTADRPVDPAEAVAAELEARDVSVPDDWSQAYAERHVDAPVGAEVPLPAHVSHALASRGVAWTENAVRRAVVAAFDPAVETAPGALESIEAARARGPVAICSNCSVPELVSRTIVRAAFDRDDFDAIVTSVGCGWRKPAPEIFELTADELGVAPEELKHVGDDPRTDGGVERIGGTAVVLEDSPLESVPDRLAHTSGGTDR